jgi:glycosyltransferase involved in cell wall biosynthesis
MSGPRVTIGMPVWNGEEFIRRGIDSLLGQTFGDLELIISDNGSTDATQAICKEYAERDPRVRYRRNARNVGLQANFAKVLELATAPYFMWGSSDDLWDASYVLKMVAVLDSHDAVVIAGSNAANIDQDGVPQSHFDNVSVYSPRGTGARAHRFICTPPGGGHATLIYGLMRTPVIQRIGFAPPGNVRDDNRGYYAMDLLTLFRLMFEGDFHVTDETLYFHRDQYMGRQGLRRLAGLATTVLDVHGYYGDLRSILRGSALDARKKSALVRVSFMQEIKFHPALGRQLVARRKVLRALGDQT